MNNLTYYRFFLFVVGIVINLISTPTFSQQTVCFGKVTDNETGKPLPYVSIGFKDSKIGTTTDFEGNYTLNSYYATDILRASSVGYIKQDKKVNRDSKQQINFSLKPEPVHLDEVVIKPDKDYENPAHVILRRIITNKSSNNREKLDSYQHETYSKIEIDLDQPRKKLINFFLFKPVKFVFDNIDSTSEGTPFLPMFITETSSDFYYRRKPKNQKEIIKATQLSGVTNESVSKLLGSMSQNINIYENKITIFDRNFVSPVADNGLTHYRYYLTDSSYINNKWCYKLEFKPRRKHELTFDGHFWVNDTTYAVKEINANVVADANLNFIQQFAINQEYNEVEKEVWLLTKDALKINARIMAPHNARYHYFIGRKAASYSKFKVNKLINDSVFDGETAVEVLKESKNIPEEQWNNYRHTPLTKHQASVYTTIDSVKNTPYYRNWLNILRGYYRLKYIEVGPYFGAYSFNAIEGDRFKLAVRSSELVNPNLRINVFGAYGLKDEQWKYGGSVRYFFSRKNRHFIKLSYKSDLEQLGAGLSVLGNDNLVSSLARRTVGNRLNGTKELLVLHEKNWNKSIATTLRFTNRTITPLGELEFINTLGSEPIAIKSFTTTEMLAAIHLSFMERFVESGFSRVSLGSDFPILDMQYSYGIPSLLGSEYEYHRTIIGISQKLRLGIYGTTKYKIEAGKVWGNLPYSLLQLHNGNETYFFNDNSFSLMNYYEFISDQYTSYWFEHHFEGLLFNKIPLFKRLNFREVIGSKGVYGSLSDSHRTVFDIPSISSPLNEPYIEVSAGIENILTMLRIDAIWRVTNLNKPDAVPFGIRAKVQVGF